MSEVRARVAFIVNGKSLLQTFNDIRGIVLASNESVAQVIARSIKASMPTAVVSLLPIEDAYLGKFFKTLIDNGARVFHAITSINDAGQFVVETLNLDEPE